MRLSLKFSDLRYYKNEWQQFLTRSVELEVSKYWQIKVTVQQECVHGIFAAERKIGHLIWVGESTS